MNAAPTTMQERAPLRRASDDRLVLGVCAGAARSLDLSPLAMRLLFVALAAVAAPLVLSLYVVLAAIIPRDDGRVLLGGAPADRRESLLGWGLIGLTLIWFAAEEFRLAGLVWPALSSFGVFAAAASALVLLAVAQRREAAAPVAATATQNDAPPETRDETAPEARDDAAPGAELVPTAPMPGSDLVASEDRPAPPPADATVIDGNADTIRFDTAPPPPRAPRRGPSLALLGLGVLLIAGAVVFLLDAVGEVDLTAGAVAAGLGAGAALAGAGAIAGALAGRRGVIGLLALGIVLGGASASVALLETELDDGIGFRTERPLTVSEIPETYRLGAGELDVDLRGTELPPGPTTIRARIAAGELTVIVPPGVRVASVGPTRVDGVAAVNAALPEPKAGKSRAARRRAARAEAARPTVRIDADIREGDADVIRTGG